jgi:hypothetical protein
VIADSAVAIAGVQEVREVATLRLVWFDLIDGHVLLSAWPLAIVIGHFRYDGRRYSTI